MNLKKISSVKKLTELIYWLKNRKSFQKPKKLNLSNILNYLEAEVQYWKSTSKTFDLPSHIEEQSIWRLSEIKKKSPECINKGRCKMCGCSIIEKSFEMQACEESCYPERMNKEEWNKFKIDNKITSIC